MEVISSVVNKLCTEFLLLSICPFGEFKALLRPFHGCCLKFLFQRCSYDAGAQIQVMQITKPAIIESQITQYKKLLDSGSFPIKSHFIKQGSEEEKNSGGFYTSCPNVCISRLHPRSPAGDWGILVLCHWSNLALVLEAVYF